MNPKWLSSVFTSFFFVIQDLFKILTNDKAIRYAFRVPLDFRYSKMVGGKLTTIIQKNHKIPTLIKTFRISRLYIKYCRLLKQLTLSTDGWGVGGETFVQITSEEPSLRQEPHKKLSTSTHRKLTKFTNVQLCPNLKHALWFDNTKKASFGIRLKNK